MRPELRRELHYGDRVVRCFAQRPHCIDQLLGAALERDPDRIALVTPNERVTYRELERRVASAAASLADRGFTKSSRLALLAGNCTQFVVTVLAAARLGVIIVPMNVLQRRPETTFMLNQCEATGLVIEAACVQDMPSRAEVPSVQHVFTIGASQPGVGESFESLLSCDSTSAHQDVQEEDGFCILYTSGTTGRPKGAMLTHLGVIHSLLHYEYGFGLQDGCVSVLAVPASHVTGLVAIILATLRVAGTVVMMPAFKARAFLQVAAQERMSYTLMVPAMYNLCLLEPELATFGLSTWRVGGFGGAPMPGVTIERLSRALPQLQLANVYGATETTSPATLFTPGEAESHPDSVGRVLPCADIIVCDDGGTEVAPGEAGELWIGGPMTIPRYWNNPDADQTSFVAGYWRSGDIGSIDAEGYVRIYDRKKDVINRGGYKIYCQEVEHLLAAHQQVLECAVVGRPDDVLGERVHAFVVARDGELRPEVLGKYCAEQLSEYKVPESFTLLTQPLPRNANGKVIKPELRRVAAALGPYPARRSSGEKRE